jgi:hypothetical protein
MDDIANAISCVNGDNLTPELDFYARIGAALFPLPRGQKSPIGIVGSFASDASRDPARWRHWIAEHPQGLNWGIVAGPSGLIIIDVDVAKAGREAAWQARNELYASWGITPFVPHCQSARGGWHDLFSVPVGIDARALRQPDLIKGLVQTRCGNGFVIASGSFYDGFAEGKASGHYMLINAVPPVPAPPALVALCTRAAPMSTAAAAPTGDMDTSDIAGLVRFLTERGEFADYESWLHLGMALRISAGEAGRDLWAISHDSTVTGSVEENKWNSFASEPTPGTITINSFMKRAHELGWKGTIRRSSAAMFDGVQSIAAAAGAKLGQRDLFDTALPLFDAAPNPGLPPSGLAPGCPVPAGTTETNALAGQRDAKQTEMGAPILAAVPTLPPSEGCPQLPSGFAVRAGSIPN